MWWCARWESFFSTPPFPVVWCCFKLPLVPFERRRLLWRWSYFQIGACFAWVGPHHLSLGCSGSVCLCSTIDRIPFVLLMAPLRWWAGGSVVSSCSVLAGSSEVFSVDLVSVVGFLLFSVWFFFLLFRIVCLCVSDQRLRVVVVMALFWFRKPERVWFF